MNKKGFLFEHFGTQSTTDEFIQQKTKFWLGSRRRAIQLLATGAGVTATMSLPIFRHNNTAIAAQAKAEGTNRQANQQRLEPNLFELQGYDTQITYSTSSTQGVPQLTYRGRGQELTFSGSDIQSESTGLGRSVTVVLENGATDLPVESLTLLLPFAQVSSSVKQLPIQTLAIFSRTALFVIPTDPTQFQTYNTISLYGTAKLV